MFHVQYINLAKLILGVNRSRQTPQRLFTPEMLNSALLQAFQSVPPVAGSPATSTTPVSNYK